ncbi:DHA2 family efflux MFS transporter permease subunit [Heliobacillus mobilis]|uniref:DHA2 family efflux MFS transporter permease subunit n=1 Tax=Heliobacterium mobile TaxID=28064 RepID=A0A6I3SF89_HELMO|nr:DHA2 family efflux MFS transporter permease subunit [Heliobacterium mobile]MTV47376.1 DHA2 family efflux MFS transporter permease subunit [Heliobacterium mobile]
MVLEYLIGYLIFALIVIAAAYALYIYRTNENLPENEPPVIDPTFTGMISGPVTEPFETPHHELARSEGEVRQVNPSPQEVNEPLQELPVGRIVTVMMLGAFVSILNQTLINVAIPHMMNDFNVSASTIQWLITGFMLVNGILIPISAFLMETFSTRQLFIAAMISFTIGSVICGFANSFAVMMIGRVVQAVGAGILMPQVMNVFLTVFPPEKRGTAMGTMGVAMIFAPAVGPTLAGWIVQNYTWRILFFIMVPIGIIDIVIAIKWLSNVAKLTYPEFDIWGVVFSTVGFGGLLYGFSRAGTVGWGSAEVILFVTLGVIGVALFIWRELTVENPMLEFRVFRYGIFSLTTAISSITNMAMFAAMLLLPIYLQNIRGFTPLQSGLLLLPGALIMGVMSPISGALFDRIGVRPLAIVGLLITAAANYEFAKLTATTTYHNIVLIYCLRSFGMSLLMMTVMTAGLNQLPGYLNSHGTAMSNTIRQVAGSLGTALLVTIMTNRTSVHLGDYMSAMVSSNPSVNQQFGGITHALALGTGVTAAQAQGLATTVVYGLSAKYSAIAGINDAFLVATGIILLAWVMSFFIRRVPYGKTES